MQFIFILWYYLVLVNRMDVQVIMINVLMLLIVTFFLWQIKLHELLDIFNISKMIREMTDADKRLINVCLFRIYVMCRNKGMKPAVF